MTSTRSLIGQELGGVEEHFRSLFDGSHNVKLTGATTNRDPESYSREA